MYKYCLAASFILVISQSANIYAAPFIPSDDAKVLEQVPQTTDPELEAISRLERQHTEAPQDLELTLKLFASYMKQARQTGNPLYAGYAETILQPWKKQSSPPITILISRASIRKYNHDFAGAKKDLDDIIKRQPRSIQARLLRANLYRIQGKYNKALQDCRSMALLSDPVTVSVCHLSISSLTGKAQWSAKKLKELLQQNNRRLTPELLEWGYTLLGETYAGQGHISKALTAFKKASRRGNNVSVYLKVARLDLLMLDNKYKTAFEMIKSNRVGEAILLRKAIAAKHIYHPEAARLAAILKSRYEDSKRAGRTQHLREEALYQLHLKNNPEAALSLALKNWSNQREPIDTLIVLSAAYRSGRHAQAASTIKWFKDVGTEHIQIQNLINLVEGRG